MKRTLLLAVFCSIFISSCTPQTSNKNNEVTTVTNTDSIRGLVGLWLVDNLLGADSIEAGHIANTSGNYCLSKPAKTGYQWGNWVNFSKEGSFESYYTAPCGVDCFPTTFGRYQIVDSLHIRLCIDSVSIHGMVCKKSIDEKVNINLGEFTVNRTDSTLTFIAKK